MQVKGEKNMLKNKNIVLGVSGGIAAYKSASIVNALIKQGANVYVIMTKNACKFITPLTLSTLSKHDVVTDLFDDEQTYDIKHIRLASIADAILVAPATANVLGKVANGIADDALSSTIIACKSKVFFAPAMNVNMLHNPIVKDNIEKLKNYGYNFINPQIGSLACGVVDEGKLANTKDIIDYLDKELS